MAFLVSFFKPKIPENPFGPKWNHDVFHPTPTPPTSVTIHSPDTSVVVMREATDTASAKAVRTTLVGSMMPASGLFFWERVGIFGEFFESARFRKLSKKKIGSLDGLLQLVVVLSLFLIFCCGGAGGDIYCVITTKTSCNSASLQLSYAQEALYAIQQQTLGT